MREWLLNLIIFSEIAIIFLFPVLLNFDYWGIGDWDQFFFFTEVQRKTIMEYHQIPLWNPYCSGGNVMLAHPLSSFLYPLFIVNLIFGTVHGLKILILIHMALGMFGMFLLSDHFKLKKYSSYLPPFLYMLSSTYTLHITEGHIEYFSMSLIPFVFLFFLKALDSEKAVKYVVLSALFFSLMFFNGTTYPFIHTGLFMLIYSLLLIFEKKNFKSLKILISVFILTFLLGAIKFIPEIEFLLKNPHTTDDISMNSIWNLYDIFLSRNQLHGSQHFSAEEIENFIKKNNLEESEVEIWGWWEYGAYVGVLPLLLYILGLFVNWRKNKSLIIVSIIFLIISLGYGSPINIWKFLRLLPIFKSLHVPSRFILIFLFCLSILSGMTLSKFEQKNEFKVFKKCFVPLILLIILLDLYLVVSPIVKDAFVIEPKKIEKSNFYQTYRGIPYSNLTYSSMYPTLLENKGSITCRDVLNLGRNARGAEDPDYRGEVYLLNGNGDAEITYFSPNIVKVKINLTKEDLLILNQNYDKGWKSKTHDVESHNNLLSTKVSPKDEQITFYYLPNSFLIGLVITSLTLISLIRLKGYY